MIYKIYEKVVMVAGALGFLWLAYQLNFKHPPQCGHWLANYTVTCVDRSLTK